MAQSISESPQSEEARVLRMTTPIGDLWLRSSGDALSQSSFIELTGRTDTAAVLQDAERQLRSYFEGTLRAFDLPLQAEGTAFQRLVWQEVSAISFGRTLSYQTIADRLGESAARAVGHANATNPLPIVLPCHRVVGSNGQLTGYLGGLERKRWLLRHEGALPAELFAGA